MDINLIKPYSKNAKKHPDKQIKQVAESIKAFGFNQPIVIDKNNTVIVGHGRLEASKLLGLKDVPVIQVDLTEEQAKAYRLADNKLNESEWDMGLVIEELKGLSEPMVDLTGFDKDLLIEPDEKDDEIPEDCPPVAQLGDIWQLGNHRVMCGDSTKIEDVEKLMDGNKADMVLTDPPYNVNYEGGTGMKIENDNMSDKSFLNFLTDSFKRMASSIKLGGSFYVWHADSEGLNFRKAIKEAGFIVKQCIIWNKNSLVMGRQDYQWKHEPCLYGWKDGSSHLWYGDRNKTTVLKVPEDEAKAYVWFKKQLKLQENKNLSVFNFNKPLKNGEHPTMKPVELLQKQIINSTKQEDVVIDFFLGSGSTLVACEKTNRICYGMELDPKYVDVIIKRWEDYTGNKALKL
jgi:DNA modification methylase